MCRVVGAFLLAFLSCTDTLADARFFADPERNYLLHCGGCHLADGRSAPPIVPTLRDEPGRITRVEGGRGYLVRVPGAAQSPLSNRDLANVLNFILREFSPETLAADFSPYTESEVAGYRNEILVDPLKRRAEIRGD